MFVGSYSVILLFYLYCVNHCLKKIKKNEIYNFRKKKILSVIFNLKGDCCCVCAEVLGKRAVRGDKKVTPQYTRAAGKQTQHIDYIIFTDTQSSLRLMFTWHEVNSTLDCRLLLCISFEAVPQYTCICDLFPPLISPITFRAELPTVSFITANILNHLSCVSH